MQRRNQFSDCYHSFTVANNRECKPISFNDVLFKKVMIKLSCLPGLAPVILFALGLSYQAAAEIFTCRDDTGHLMTADRPIPECSSKTTQVFTDNGTLKKQLSQPLTTEQRHAAELLMQHNAEQVQLQHDLDRERRFLKTHYPNEAAIEVAREKERHGIADKMALENKTIKTATDALHQQQNALGRLPANQLSQKVDVQLKIDSLQQTIRDSGRQVQSYQTQLRSVDRDYDATHERYVELISGPKN